MPGCKQCQSSFEVSDQDRAFYRKMNVPEPTLCPHCRQQRRLTFRNERSLYKRKCDATGKLIISMYNPDAPFPVYSQEYWYGDGWDPKEYGQEFDFGRPFFEQLKELISKVPRFALTITKSENCEYNNFCASSRNCYMSNRLGDSEEVYYSYLAIESKDIVDCYNVTRCQICYEVVDADNCYDVFFGQNLSGCSVSRFLFDCRNAKHCFFCAGLRNAEYCFFNEPLSKEEYEKKIGEYEKLAHSKKEDLRKRFLKLCSEQVVPAYWGNKTENVSGNYLLECKNVFDSYDCTGLEDGRYAYGHIYGNNAMDTVFSYHIDWAYEFAAGTSSRNLLFCFNILENCYNMTYCMDCVNNCHDCFGCIGLKHAQYCILNKQYSKEEYEALVPKIIEHMKQTGEWGEFFPITLSPFGYNETVAQEYFPLKKEEVSAKGWKWKEEESDLMKVEKIIPAGRLPDSISDIPDDILNWAIECEVTKKLFKIIPQELKFYHRFNLPVPRKCPDQRHLERIALRNPRKLWDRQCAKCRTAIKTTYSPDRPEIVYCEACYLKEVY